jgi:hypothetical protein
MENFLQNKIHTISSNKIFEKKREIYKIGIYLLVKNKK